jgi:hypothetical protein
MNEKLATEIAEYMVGTCNGEDDAAELFKVDAGEVLQACSDNEVERCECCGWWCGAEDFGNSRVDELVCDECMESEEDE